MTLLTDSNNIKSAMEKLRAIIAKQITAVGDANAAAKRAVDNLTIPKQMK